MRALVLAALALLAPAAHAKPCQPAPFGDTQLYLRGSLNNWAAQDEQAFEYRCDAYYLNLLAEGWQEFKIADEAWTPDSTLGSDAQGRLARGGAVVGNYRLGFRGAQTLRLRFGAQGQPLLELRPPGFKPTPPARITDEAALSTHFDSRVEGAKSPFGAQPQGTEIRFSLGSSRPGLLRATLVLEKRLLSANQEQLSYEPLQRIAMTPEGRGLGTGFTATVRFDEIGVFGYWFELETDQGRYALQNNKDTVAWTREKGSMGPAVVERLPSDTRRIRRYRQTIHAADYTVPAWAQDAVYYAIFPERFRNGDPANDPRPGGGRVQDRYQDHEVEHHARWIEKPFKPGSGDGSDGVYNNDFFGGDLAGIIEKLDYIKALGANTIYLTPIFRAASNHKYDTADYTQVDPALGSNADFERLCAEAAKRGLRVLPDASLNHVGADSLYFDRFARYDSQGAFRAGRIQPDSPYAGWFSFDASQSSPDKQFKGWVGVTDLPELDKRSRAFRDFAYGSPGGVMQRWLDRGGAGWRMDVAPWVPDDFWREWRRAVKAHRPDAITIAETWFDASKYFLGDSFDGTMNYIFRSAALDFAAGGDARRLAAQLELMREAYPPQSLLANMNLLSSHDQPRALFALGERDDSSAAQRRLARQRLRLAWLLQMSAPGAPSVYYGDEVGVGGGEDPYNRAPYPWADQGGQPDESLHADLRRLLALRQRHAVLRQGLPQAPLLATKQHLALPRRLGEAQVLTVLSNAPAASRISVPLSHEMPTRWRDALSGEVFQAVQGRLTLTLPALGGRILLNE
ncbi:hypothetical protein H5407_02620 [Mitsuaria sp. WAJ17]|uniref:alpha-amylase family glycosyl hydrolase n=1 Tax=Mitsuaria sp. WAJ17 TaxID=2761452 RepID=UPI0015FFFC1F|nr:alpha-amylase family glycosyl hydrolase [Mitsuaria sp. WAJ17]MBB2484112.1 hypothetical protein [Mitsuaria sp. WAJ17]